MSLLRTRALLCALALVALSVPLLVTATPAVAAGAVTVEGNWHPWNPLATDNGDGTFTGAYDETRTPSVTVDRTTNLGDEVVQVSWQNFTPTSNLTTYYGPDGKPTARPLRITPIQYGVNVFECRGAHPTRSPSIYTGADGECYRVPAEPNAPDGEFGQNNALRTVTQNDGTGSVAFHVENATSNDLLRCSSSQPCSIVVVPNQGGVQKQTDTKQDISGCDDHSGDFFGPPLYGFDTFALDTFETSPCAWSKRIIVPLSFAPIADSCPDSSVGFTAVGSPSLRRGLGQLLAGWCRGRNAVNFDYNFSSNEYLARSRFAASASGLGSSTDVALVTQPADPGTAGDKRFLYAPIANDAVAIPYQIDNPRTGRPIDDLRLDARLVAKLLTQSYAPGAWNCAAQKQQLGKAVPWCAPRVNGNPLSVFDDPEFQALNFRGDHPDRASFPDPEYNGVGDYFPTVASGDSDLTWELTRWIAADPDARAFLQGRPDEYGMRINTSYLPDAGQRAAGATLYPTSAFQPLDPGWDAPQKVHVGTGNDPRTYQGFQGSWNPIGNLQSVATTMVGNRSTAYQAHGECYDSDGNFVNCPQGTTSIPVQFKKAPALAVGLRDLTAVTENTDAQSYRFPTAQLVTRTGDAVAPTTASMARALAAMRTNPDKVTQYVDHATAPGNAYPAMLPVYAMVPTCGVSRAKAAAISAMLGRVVDSQTYGLEPGTLTNGLLALSPAQLRQTRAAAAAVSSQSCVTSPRDETIAGRPARNTGGGNGRGPSSDRPIGQARAGGGASGPSAGTTGSATVAPSGAPNPSAASPSSAPARNAGYALDDSSGSMSLLLPLFLALGGAALLGTPLVWWLAGTPAGRAALTRLRPRR